MHGTRHSCSMSPLLHVLTLATCLARLGCGAQQSLQPADTSLFSLDGVLQPGDQGELGEDTGEQEEVPDKQEVVPEEQEEVPEEQEVPDEEEEVHDEQKVVPDEQEEVPEEQEEVPDEEEEVPDEQEEGSRVRVTESGAVVRSQVTEQGRVVNIDQADLTLDYDLGDPEQDPGLVLKTGEVVYPCDGAGDTCQIDGTPGVCRGPEPLTCIAISNTTTVPTVPTTTISTTRVPETSSSTTTTANTNVTTPASAVSDATPGGDNAASGAASRSDEGSLDTTLIIAIAAAASVVLALAVTAAVCYKRSKASKASYNVAETENIRRPKQAHV